MLNFYFYHFIRNLKVTLLALIMVSGTALFHVNAQTTKTVGGAGADYSTLKSAFDAVNAGTITGAINLQITGNTSEAASAILNASGSGSASYSSVSIYPTVSGRMISGNIAAPLIDLNGADNVTFDGRVNATGNSIDLTITNASTSATAGTSTIRLYKSAEKNTVKYCTIKGSETNASSGVIFFSTATTGTGNDDNTIDHNIITSDAAGRPVNAIFSLGSPGYENNGNIISNNNICDFFKQATASCGINLSSFTTMCTISGNSFYETTSFAPTASVAYNVIQINNISGNGFIVSGNYIGGHSALCGGIAWTMTSAKTNIFYAIYLNVGTNMASSVQENTIKNIQWTGWGSPQWYGIYVAAGNINIGTISGNTIGAETGTGSVTIENTNMNAISYGMFISGSGEINIDNNKIGSVTTKNLITKSHDFYAIYRIGSGATTISNNLIGSLTTANSIDASTESSGNAQNVYGIYNSATGAITINGNTITNLNNAYKGTSTSSQTIGIFTIAGSNAIDNNTIANLTNASPQSNYKGNASVIGIVQTSGNSGQTISGNLIYNLINTTTLTTFEGGIMGLYYNGAGSGTNNISNNYIYNLSVLSNSNKARIYGIQIGGGTATYYNNIISLGNNVNYGNFLFGISDDGSGACNIYFNTVYIGGNSPVSSSPSFALISTSNNNTRNYRNNIFINARSGGSSGTHYAICVAKTTNLTIDFNNYYVSGVGGVLGGEGSIWYRANKATLNEWKNFTGQDANSLASDPAFATPGGIFATDFIPSSVLPGITIGSITTDYSGATRAAIPTMGAWERISINKWKGALSNNWNTAGNWTGNTVPAADDNIIFDENPVNHCQLDQNRSVNNITNAQSAYRLITNGHKLTVKGDLIFSNGAKIDASASGSNIEFAGSSAQTIPVGVFNNNKVYDLTVNNTDNVTLNGTLYLLNTITAASGRLDAITNSPAIIYAGNSAQIIGSDIYLNDRLFDITSDNADGVTLTSNALTTITGALTINSGKKFNIAPGKQLTVAGTITNNAGASNFVLQSDTTGTASFIHNTNNVQVTIQRYISGSAEAWHFLSSPVAAQSMSSSWLPSGSYGNGTGYDLYLWNEPTNCWIYKLNTRWDSLHPGADFVVGRGYLYSVQEANPTNEFVGNLNNGTVNYGLTSSSNDPSLIGFNLVGNPYPSSIDWSASSGWSRSNLVSSGDGFNMWIWNPEANNYGVYNSADTDGAGTNFVTRYIAPMQGYFVQASRNGILGMDNNVRVHDNAGSWFKNTEINAPMLSVVVKSEADNSYDEVRLQFGYAANQSGATKLFSHVITAPSLYMTSNDQSYSVRHLSDTAENPIIPLVFKPGKDGGYMLNCNFDDNKFETVLLEDCQTHYVQNMKTASTYSFQASKTDDPNRFVLHFRSGNNAFFSEMPARIYFDGTCLMLDLTLVSNETEALVYDAMGRLLLHKTLPGLTQHKLNINATAQILVVHLKNQHGILCRKLYYKNK